MWNWMNMRLLHPVEDGSAEPGEGAEAVGVPGGDTPSPDAEPVIAPGQEPPVDGKPQEQEPPWFEKRLGQMTAKHAADLKREREGRTALEQQILQMNQTIRQLQSQPRQAQQPSPQDPTLPDKFQRYLQDQSEVGQSWRDTVELNQAIVDQHLNPVEKRLQELEQRYEQNYETMRQRESDAALAGEMKRINQAVIGEIGGFDEDYPLSDHVYDSIGNQAMTAVEQKFNIPFYDIPRLEPVMQRMALSAYGEAFRELTESQIRAQQEWITSKLKGGQAKLDAGGAADPGMGAAKGSGVSADFDILKDRYMKGEISDEEYNRLASELERKNLKG